MRIKTENTLPNCATIYVSGQDQPNEHFYDRKIPVSVSSESQYVLETLESDTIYVTIKSNCGSIDSAGNRIVIDSASTNTLSATIPSVNFSPETCIDDNQGRNIIFAIDQKTRPDCDEFYQSNSNSAPSSFYYFKTGLNKISKVYLWPVVGHEATLSGVSVIAHGGFGVFQV